MRSGERSAEEVIAEARERVEHEVPEARVEFVQVLQDVLNDLSGTPRPIEIKLFGSDYAGLRPRRGRSPSALAGVRGLVDLYAGVEGEAPELKLRLDAGDAARLGLTAAEVTADLDAALHGTVASVIRRADRPLGVRVRYADAIRFDGKQLEQLPLLPTAGGGHDLDRRGGCASSARRRPSVLLRENLRPTVIVTADHESRDLGSVVGDVQDRLRGLVLPEGYTSELGGQYRAQQETFRDLARVSAFGLLGVLAVLLAQFRRSRMAVVVLASVPLAVVGALATPRRDRRASQRLLDDGLHLLVGLVVKNGILLARAGRVALASGLRPCTPRCSRPGSIRVRPILMTTLATIAGLAPLALRHRRRRRDPAPARDGRHRRSASSRRWSASS